MTTIQGRSTPGLPPGHEPASTSLAPPVSIDNSDCAARTGSRTAPPAGAALYTLDDARRELAAIECGQFGHDYEDVETLGGGLIAIECGRGCGHPGWDVHDRDRPDLDAALVRHMLTDLWADLAAAYRASTAKPRETSVACHGLIKRIQDVSRHAGPTDPFLVEPLILVTGLYEIVHAGAGIDVSVPELLMRRARAILDEQAGPA